MTEDELSELHAYCFETPRPWSAEEFALLSQDRSVRLITRKSGFAMIRVVGDEVELLTLAVAPDTHRKGIGTALMNDAMDAARAVGARTMFLEVSAENTAAIGLYRKLGFQQAGLRKTYYRRPDGSRIDALTLRKSL